MPEPEPEPNPNPNPNQAHALLQTGVSEQNQALTGVALQVLFNLGVQP